MKDGFNLLNLGFIFLFVFLINFVVGIPAVADNQLTFEELGIPKQVQKVPSQGYATFNFSFVLPNDVNWTDRGYLILCYAHIPKGSSIKKVVLNGFEIWTGDEYTSNCTTITIYPVKNILNFDTTNNSIVSLRMNNYGETSYPELLLSSYFSLFLPKLETKLISDIPQTIDMNDTLKVSVEIKNTSEVDAQNITVYSEGSEFTVKENYTLTLVGNYDLDNSTKNLSFYFKPIKTGTQKLGNIVMKYVDVGGDAHSQKIELGKTEVINNKIESKPVIEDQVEQIEKQQEIKDTNTNTNVETQTGLTTIVILLTILVIILCVGLGFVLWKVYKK